MNQLSQRRRQAKPDHPRRRRYENALDKQLTRDVRVPRANRASNRKLTPAAGGTQQHEVADVDARDEKQSDGDAMAMNAGCHCRRLCRTTRSSRSLGDSVGPSSSISAQEFLKLRAPLHRRPGASRRRRVERRKPGDSRPGPVPGRSGPVVAAGGSSAGWRDPDDRVLKRRQSVTRRPITSRSARKSRCHATSLSTNTGAAPNTSSVGSSNRPSTGLVPSV